MSDLNEINRTLGRLEGLVEGVNQRLDTINGSVAECKKGLAKHEVVLGKIGLVTAAIGSIFGILSTTVYEWFKR